MTTVRFIASRWLQMDGMINPHPSENFWSEWRYLLCEIKNGQPHSTLFHALLHVLGSNETYSTHRTTHSAYQFNCTDRLSYYDRMHLHQMNTWRWFLWLRHVCLVQWRQTVEDGDVCINSAQQLLPSWHSNTTSTVMIYQGRATVVHVSWQRLHNLLRSVEDHMSSCQ